MPLFKIQHRHDTAANWAAANPVLLPGELGLITDSPGNTVTFKVGDGTRAWSALPVVSGPPGQQGLQGEDGKDGAEGKQGPPGSEGPAGAQGPIGDTGSQPPISDSVTSADSGVSASSYAVKVAYDKAMAAQATATVAQTAATTAQTAANSVSWTSLTGKPATFAPVAHNHDAGNITSGILPIARGGTSRGDGKAVALATPRTISVTGLAWGTTAPTFDGTANAVMTLTGLDISKATHGILPIARGGTGRTTGAAPKPQAAAGVGQWSVSHSSTVTLPAGGSWAWIQFRKDAGGTMALENAGVSAGGTAVPKTGSINSNRSVIHWRIA